MEAKAEIRATPAAILQQTQQARQQLTAAIQQIRQLPGYEKFLTLPTFEDISRSLQPNQPLIYLTTTEYGSLALIVERSPLSRGAKGGSPSSLVVENSITPLEIDNLNDTRLRELLGGTETSWFGAYDNRQNNPQNWFDAIDRVTNELWSKLMQPVISHLQTREVKQAILIPTGLLGLLPLHAAWTEDSSKPCKRRYALDEITFTYAPNALSLNNAREIARRVSPDTMLAVDEPATNLRRDKRNEGGKN